MKCVIVCQLPCVQLGLAVSARGDENIPHSGAFQAAAGLGSEQAALV